MKKTRTFLSVAIAVAMMIPLSGAAFAHITDNETPLVGATLPGETVGHDELIGHGLFASMPRLVMGGCGSQFNLGVDLRPYCPPVYDQGLLGSCTAFASAKGALEIERRIENLPAPEMSALYMYYYERSALKKVDKDSGARLLDAAYVLKQRGAVSEATVPYDIAAFKDKPSPVADVEASSFRVKSATSLLTLQAIIDEVLAEHPVMGGVLVFRSFGSMESVITGIIPMPDPLGKEDLLGAHAICIVGVDMASKYFLVRNSWGPQWGDGGYCYISFEYIQRYGFDYWGIRCSDGV